MERYFLLQVLGTCLEVTAYSLADLETKGKALKAMHKLSGRTYRVFIGKRPMGSNADFTFGTYAKQAVFA